MINDPAEWSGWEVHARTRIPKRDFIIIIMRRKYLPPMMENYVEIAIAFYGPENDILKDDDQEEEEEENNEDNDNSKNDDGNNDDDEKD